MYITNEHIGKKVRFGSWSSVNYFIPLSYSITEGKWYGLNEQGNKDWWHDGAGWELVPEETPQQEGLSLLEAIQSGRSFRPLGGLWPSQNTGEKEIPWASLKEYSDRMAVWFNGSDQPGPIDEEVLTARYELRPESKKLEITAESLNSALKAAARRSHLGSMYYNQFLQYLREELGLC